MVDLDWFSTKDGKGWGCMATAAEIMNMVLDGLSVEVAGADFTTFIFQRSDRGPSFRGTRWCIDQKDPLDQELSSNYWRHIWETVVVEMYDTETEEAMVLPGDRATRILYLLDQMSQTPSIPIRVGMNDKRAGVAEVIYDMYDFREKSRAANA